MAKLFLALWPCQSTHLFLGRCELCDISVVALFPILVGALQDWVLLQFCHCLLLVDAAESSLRILLTAAEVDPTRNDPTILLPPSSTLLVVMVAEVEVASGQTNDQ